MQKYAKMVGNKKSEKKIREWERVQLTESLERGNMISDR
jgi:hypothetical protein